MRWTLDVLMGHTGHGLNETEVLHVIAGVDVLNNARSSLRECMSTELDHEKFIVELYRDRRSASIVGNDTDIVMIDALIQKT